MIYICFQKPLSSLCEDPEYLSPFLSVFLVKLNPPGTWKTVERWSAWRQGSKAIRVTWSPSSTESAGRAEGESGWKPRNPAPIAAPGPAPASAPGRSPHAGRLHGPREPISGRHPRPITGSNPAPTAATRGALAPETPPNERHAALSHLPGVLRPTAQPSQEALTPWGHFCCAQDHVGVCHGDIKGHRGRKERNQSVDCAPGWEEGPGARIPTPAAHQGPRLLNLCESVGQ